MRIHILGICGTFMAGIAVIAKQLGHQVSGCDANVYPPMSDQLRQQGIHLVEGFDASQLEPRPDLVIIGNAMKRGNPCVEYVLNKAIPYTSGPQWLAEFVLQDRHVLAVSGTHGKTTTTSMLAWLLEDAGYNPSFLIGGVPENFGVSARLTDSAFFVIEADEYDSAFFDKRSKFIHYHPRTLILNNLEFDHADIFSSLADIQKQFEYLLRTVPSEGLVIKPASDENLTQVVAQGCWTAVVQTALNDQKVEWAAVNIQPDGSEFDVYHQQQKVAHVSWALLGQHNVNNALVAMAAAYHVGVRPEVAAASLATFKNVKRRLEVRGVAHGVTVYDDFAHHPTAINTTIAGLRGKVGDARIIAVLECGSYTMRTGYHRDHLADALTQANLALVMQPKDCAWDVTDSFKNSKIPSEVLPNVEAILERLKVMVREGDHVLIMSNSGFGGIHQKLLEILNQ